MPADDEDRCGAGVRRGDELLMAGDDRRAVVVEVLDAHRAGEARRRRLDLGEQRGRIGRVRLREAAGATDHLARLADRVVGAVRVALVVAVAEGEQGGAVAGLGVGERRGERRPLGLAVHRLDRRRLEHDLVDAAAVGGGERVGVEAVEQGVPAGADVDGVEGAVVALLAPRRPVVEGVLEPDELRRPLVELAVTARLERRVEHHRPHPLREQPGVDAAEVRAVADADVGDLLVAEGGADRVHVACGVGGGVEAQRVVVLRLARRAELVVDGVEGLLPPRACRACRRGTPWRRWWRRRRSRCRPSAARRGGRSRRGRSGAASPNSLSIADAALAAKS